MPYRDEKGRIWNPPLDYEGYPMLAVYHLDHKESYWIKRDGYYPDIHRMVNLEDEDIQKT